MPRHFTQSHIRSVDASSLAVTSHRHFWQNERYLVRATTVTRGWKGYRSKSPHKTLTLEKEILPPVRPGLSLRSFDHESCALTTELSPSASILKQRDKETNDMTGVWRLSRQRGNRWRLHYFDLLLHRYHLHVRPSRWALHTHTRGVGLFAAVISSPDPVNLAM